MAPGRLSSELTLGHVCHVGRWAGSVAGALADPDALALVVDGCGGAAFTRSVGGAPPPHPAARLAWEAAGRHAEETGDDRGPPLLLFGRLSEGLAALVLRRGEEDARKVLLRELPALSHRLPDLVDVIREKGAVLSPADAPSFPEELAGVVGAFFADRCGGSASAELARLVHSFVLGSAAGAPPDPALDAVLARPADAFFTKVLAAPLALSLCVPGLLLPRADGHLRPGDRFVVARDLRLATEGASWGAGAAARAQETTSHLARRLGVRVVLSAEHAPPLLGAIFDRLGLEMAGGLPEEELGLLLDACGLEALPSLFHPVGVEHVGEVRVARPLQVGPRRFTHWEPRWREAAPFLPHHVVLCAPAETAWRDYRSLCLGCLRWVRQWLAPPRPAGVSYPPGAFPRAVRATLGRGGAFPDCGSAVGVLEAGLRGERGGSVAPVPAAVEERRLWVALHLIRQLCRVDAILSSK